MPWLFMVVGAVHVVAKVVEVTQTALQVLSHILSLKFGDYDRYQGLADSVLPDNLMSLAGSLLVGSLEFVPTFALVFLDLGMLVFFTNMHHRISYSVRM